MDMQKIKLESLKAELRLANESIESQKFVLGEIRLKNQNLKGLLDEARDLLQASICDPHSEIYLEYADRRQALLESIPAELDED